ncbi:hypothetical protein UACE39S_05893 [Ureibacillus acetophenoni]
MIKHSFKDWFKRETWTKKRIIFLTKITLPFVLLFCSILLNVLFGNQIISSIQDNKWSILITITFFILYTSWTFPEFFRKYNQNLRRTWYFFFILGSISLIYQSGFDIEEWQRYMLLAGMFIFVDLALFLTPSIKKIGGAEMEPIIEVESIN